MSAGDLQKLCLLRPEEMTAILEKLRAAGRVVSLPGGALTHSAVVEAAAAKMLAAVSSFHTANPQRAGLSREELFSLVGGPADICELAATSLVNANRLQRQGAVFTQAGWSARITDRDQQLSDRIGEAFQSAGWAGPTAADLATTLNEPPARVEKMIKLLTEKAVLVRLDERLCIHRDSLEAAKQEALRLFGQKRSFSTMEFRDALGVSRKHAVPLLDYLDKVRFTVRSGHDRTPGVEARKFLK